MRRMCECFNAQCPYHTGVRCDIPAVADVSLINKWGRFGLCQQCLDMAVRLDPVNLQILKPITASVDKTPSNHPSQRALFPEIPVYSVISNQDSYGRDEFGPVRPGWRCENPDGTLLPTVFDTPEQARSEILKKFPGAQVEMPRTSRLLKKGAVTGNETFDRVWGDFHTKIKAPENEDREFHEVFGDHDGKHQFMIALGKLNYTVMGGGFEDWIAEGYAASTGDLLINKLPFHDHVYPLLSKLYDMLRELLEAYQKFGVTSFDGIERLLVPGPSQNTLWNWFKKEKKDMFRFRGRVNEPYDLEYISGRWGHTRLDDETVTQELKDKYVTEATKIEAEIESLPVPSSGERKSTADKRSDLLEHQATLDALVDAIDYRITLQNEWVEFKNGGWASAVDKTISDLNMKYSEIINLRLLITEAAEWFNTTPDEVYSVERMGEEDAVDATTT